jgi:hypothetical protein
MKPASLRMALILKPIYLLQAARTGELRATE